MSPGVLSAQSGTFNLSLLLCRLLLGESVVLVSDDSNFRFALCWYFSQVTFELKFSLVIDGMCLSSFGEFCLSVKF